MRLGDYSSDTRFFEFDPDTGAYSHLRLPAARKDSRGYSGVGQLLRELGQGRVLVAQYLMDGDGWISIGAQKWRLFDESLAIEHGETHWGFVCQLAVHQAGTCLRKLRYWRRDWFAMIIDPTYDWLDFSLANLPVDFPRSESSSLQKQREDFIKLWSAWVERSRGL